jgi:tryptophan synthase alpha subunit
LAKGQFDVFDLFTEVILKNLNENGVYGLILPDSVFSQEQARFRCLLSKNTTIDLIARLGEKYFPK